MRIGIATAFSGMMDFYSLTSIILSQIKMVVNAGHTAVLIVMDDFGWHEIPKWATQYLKDGKLEVRQVIPSFNKIDYMKLDDMTEEHRDQLMPKIIQAFVGCTQDLDAVFAHDLIFTGWNLPIGLASKEVSDMPGACPWFHWVHSVPGGHRDYWRLPENSMLVYPNNEDRVRCAENFRTWKENVLVVPHPCDMRDYMMTSDYAIDLITKFDVLGADLVQVYPVPTDRLEAKGIPWVIKMMAMFKNLHKSVKLVIPNAWCTIPEWRDKVERMYQLGEDLGLTRYEMIFTSYESPTREVGLPMTDIKDLILCGNIFICPTVSETFGLSLTEAMNLGNLMILNEDLPMLREICGGNGNAIWAKFGSNFYNTHHKDEKLYLHDICQIALHHMEQSHEHRSKTFARQAYRREAVWQRLENAIKSFKSSRTPLHA